MIWRCFICDREAFFSLCQEASVFCKPLEQTESSVSKRRLICPDISNGLENIAIPVYNEVDQSPPPNKFTYIVNNVFGSDVHLATRNPSFITCCSCTDNCSNPKVCECAIAMNGFAYDKNRLYCSDKTSGVYECNYLCSCHQDLCRNRLVGNGPIIPLEVFRCQEAGKGWGVRCSVDIPAGTFVADYLGEVLHEVEAESRADADKYLFVMDAYARNHACQVLSDVGLKKLYLPDPEIYNSLENIDKDKINDLVGTDIAEKLVGRKKLISLTNNESEGSQINGKKRCRGEPDSSNVNVIGNSYSSKVDNSIMITADEKGDCKSVRKRKFRVARATLMERIMTDVETKSKGYTLDAK